MKIGKLHRCSREEEPSPRLARANLCVRLAVLGLDRTVLRLDFVIVVQRPSILQRSRSHRSKPQLEKLPLYDRVSEVKAQLRRLLTWAVRGAASRGLQKSTSCVKRAQSGVLSPPLRGRGAPASSKSRWVAERRPVDAVAERRGRPSTSSGARLERPRPAAHRCYATVESTT